MKSHIILFIMLLCISNIIAQSVGINSTGQVPDSSAMLDVSSSEKGLLIPRLTLTQRNAIPNPAQGLLIFNTSNNTFQYYANGWQALNTSNTIMDLDKDTYVHAEPTPDADSIVIVVNDHDVIAIDSNSIEVLSNDLGVYIGRYTGNHVSVDTSRIVAIGYKALEINNVGTNNTAIGFQALRYNTEGSANVAVGTNALEENTTGGYNIAVGSEAQQFNRSGNSNIGMGYRAGRNLHDGNSNVNIGHQSGRDNISGNGNVTMGFDAHRANQSGNFNIALGMQALDNHADGHENIAIGRLAMDNVTNGNYNIALGHQAGHKLNGNENIIIGKFSGNSLIGDRNIILGNSVAHGQSITDRLWIDNSLTSGPLIYGEFDNDYLRFNGIVNILNKYSLPDKGGKLHNILLNRGNLPAIWSPYKLPHISGNDGDILQLQDDSLNWISTATFDTDVTNELQFLTINGRDLSISNGNTIPLPSSMWTASNNAIHRIGRVGIYTTAPAGALQVVVDSVYKRGVYITNSGSDDTAYSGEDIELVNFGTGEVIGTEIDVQALNSDFTRGITSYVSTNAPGDHVGIESFVHGAGTALKAHALQPQGKAAQLIGETDLLGQVSIGTSTKIGQLHINNPIDSLASVVITPQNGTSQGSSQIVLGEDDDATFAMIANYNGIDNQLEVFGRSSSNLNGPHLCIKRDNGQVAIGDRFASGYKLSVNGNIICEELVVDLTTDWPDYVFEPEYKLLSLEEIEQFIQQNGHLPKVRPAHQVEAEGIKIGDTQVTMMEKIEELTLHLIAMNKQQQALLEKIEQLENLQKSASHE